jgi:hypothetical protein
MYGIMALGNEYLRRREVFQAFAKALEEWGAKMPVVHDGQHLRNGSDVLLHRTTPVYSAFVRSGGPPGDIHQGQP